MERERERYRYYIHIYIYIYTYIYYLVLGAPWRENPPAARVAPSPWTGALDKRSRARFNVEINIWNVSSSVSKRRS